MAKVAAERGWEPGSFLNKNFDLDCWTEHLKQDLLNEHAQIVRAGDLKLEQASFVRPVADNKSFDGSVFTPSAWETWQSNNPLLLDQSVAAATPKEIFRETRLFAVAGQIVTGSVYKQGGSVFLSKDIDPDTISYAQDVMSRWQPAPAFVIDVALTRAGHRVIEFNNINSSGFYASDVGRYVDAIDAAYG